MRFKFILFFLLTLGTISAFAAETSYRVLAATGTCMAQRGANPDEYVRVITGLEIYPNDKIIITGSSSYISLVSADGRMIELEKGGVYHVKTLLSNSSGESPFLAKHYVDILTQNTMSVMDSVNRYESYITSTQRSSTSTKIKMSGPQATKIQHQKTNFTWVSAQEISNFNVSIKDIYGEEVFTESTQSNNLTIDFNLVKLLPGQVYSLSVVDQNNTSNSSESISIRVPSRSELAKFETELELLTSEIPQNKAVSDMVLATYCEENGLFYNAITYYQNAISLQPNVVEYSNAYDLLLYKLGLN